MNLRRWAFGAVLITTVMIGITGFITEGVALYGLNDDFDAGSLENLEKVGNSTSIAKEARRRAEQAEARSNFFTLPNIVNLLRLPFQSIPVWEAFIGTGIQILGIQHASQGWPMILVSSFILIYIAYEFANRVL